LNAENITGSMVVIYIFGFAHFHARFIGALTHPVSFDPGS